MVASAAGGTVAGAVQPISVPADVAPLFQPLKLGRHTLTNRLVYPPLTRARATGFVPQPAAIEYYTQRAYPGSLFIAEGTIPSRDGHGFPDSPGIYTQEQVEAWKPIVKAVQDKGTVFFCQLWHTGRASHTEFQEGGKPPVSSTNVPITDPDSKVWLGGTRKENFSVPHALTKEEIKLNVDQWVQAARNAIAAGFDGVEIHGANGYLIDQFTKSKANNRTDEYGGSIENRCRFALEVTAAMVDAIGADRVGIRLSPFNDTQDAIDATPYATFVYLVEQLNKFGLAFLHLIEGRSNLSGTRNLSPDWDPTYNLKPFRAIWKGPLIVAGGYTRESGAAAVRTGHADLVAYGRSWLATPDLPKRFLLNAPLNAWDRASFYIPDQVKGYTDYPFLEQLQLNSQEQ